MLIINVKILSFDHFFYFNSRITFVIMSQENLSLAYQNIDSLLGYKTLNNSPTNNIEKRSWFTHFTGKNRNSNLRTNIKGDNSSEIENFVGSNVIHKKVDEKWMHSIRMGVLDINRMLNRYEGNQYTYQHDRNEHDHDQYKWQVCGRIYSTNQQDKNRKINNDSSKNGDKGSSKMKNIRVRNLEAGVYENHGNGANSVYSENTLVGPDLGYTCGLWFLLHYYTG